MSRNRLILYRERERERGKVSVGGREGGLRDDDDIVPEGGGPLVRGAVPGRARRCLDRDADADAAGKSNQPTQSVRKRETNHAADRDAHLKLRLRGGEGGGGRGREEVRQEDPLPIDRLLHG